MQRLPESVMQVGIMCHERRGASFSCVLCPAMSIWVYAMSFHTASVKVFSGGQGRLLREPCVQVEIVLTFSSLRVANAKRWLQGQQWTWSLGQNTSQAEEHTGSRCHIHPHLPAPLLHSKIKCKESSISGIPSSQPRMAIHGQAVEIQADCDA